MIEKNIRFIRTVELIIAACMIFVFIGMFALYAKTTVRIACERALIEELNNIRTSIEHYRIIKKALPKDLLALMKQEFTFTAADGIIIQQKFLKPFRVDDEGNLLDPFFNQYEYDKNSGRVFSRTRSYEHW